jgi:hypothetical protein
LFAKSWSYDDLNEFSSCSIEVEKEISQLWTLWSLEMTMKETPRFGEVVGIQVDYKILRLKFSKMLFFPINLPILAHALLPGSFGSLTSKYFRGWLLSKRTHTKIWNRVNFNASIHENINCST